MAAKAYVGIMSGTSLDAADAVLFLCDAAGRGRAEHAATVPLPQPLRQTLLELNTSGPDELHRAAIASLQLVELYAQAVHTLLYEAGLTSGDIAAIGVHGQTVRHRPDLGYTIQLNAPARLAELTGIDVIADFRSRDVAAGGQGAPLVPAFHAAQFAAGHTRVVLNLGGIANITILSPTATVRGFDTGPANMLMDLWALRHLGTPFDAQGAWAASGTPITALLELMLGDPWFSLAPPKSTGRDDFSAAWLDRHLAAYARQTGLTPEPADVQATLLQLTARSVADAIARYAPGTGEVVVCGGGGGNLALMEALRGLLPCPLAHTDDYGLPAQWVEAAAFAWLAWCHDTGRPAGLPEVTGARKATILGCRYPA